MGGFGGRLGGWGGGLGGSRPKGSPAVGNNPPVTDPLALDVNNNLRFSNSYYAPTIAGFDQQNAALAARLGQVSGAAGAGAGPARELADIRRRQLDNQIASTGIDISAIPRQMQYLDAGFDITGRSKDSTLGLVDQLMGLTEGDYQNALSRAQLSYRGASRDWANQVAAQGSSTAPETRLKQNDIDAQKWLDQNTASSNKISQQAQLTNQRQQALLDYETAGLSVKEQKAKLGDREKQLRLQADNYKLDQDALLASLNGQLAGMNLQGILSAGQVLDQINSNNTQQAQFANGLLQAAIQDAYAKQQATNPGGTPIPVRK